MRTDGDSWDIVSSVGLTALGVATFRALETVRPDALIQDDFAQWFVEAAGEPHFTGLLADPSSLGDMPFSGFMGFRTRFFDEFFSSATSAGVSQAVILAAGLDARAYRLDWPTGTTVFEVDQPQVLDFKEEVLADHGARAKADRRPVAVDLRDDWPAALQAAGFDPGKPTAWSVEGLLAYLPGAAHDALFERIDELSSPGSHLAVDNFAAGTDLQRFEAIRAKYFAKNPFGDIDISELFYGDERADPVQWLTGHGWSVRRANSLELAAAYGRPVPDLPEELVDLSKRSTYLTAVK
ncbi:class I SAM-dependent methyltransferase [Rhodococcus sp. NPDC127530]|uniref:class I SAM-dependent methyltransferase n=1 Tax=unclassified Rhodococcus (in: high G+C Gram-positive bacteria) TaxID=192944 RepID=UPI00364156FA